jgi:simple sugar transport system permease protein
VLALIVGSVVIIASSVLAVGEFDLTLPLTAYAALIEGALGIGSPEPINAITRTIVNSGALLLAGLSVALGFKAGLFNIGGTGQLVIGGFTAAVVGAQLATAAPIVAIPTAVVAGALAGAFYGFIPGALKAYTGAHEVVTTIMLNYIAILFVSALIQNVFKAPGFTFDRTADVGNAGLPIIFGRDLHLGIPIALAFVPLVGWLLTRTTLGFEIRTVGANPDAARYAGMSPRRIVVLTMSLCGMLAGLAGVILILGEVRNFPATFGTGIAFDAIAVALLGRANPVGVLFAALLFGGMRAGAPLMQIRADVPIEIVAILQATILFFLTAEVIVRRLIDVRGGAGGAQLPAIGRRYGEEAAA